MPESPKNPNQIHRLSTVKERTGLPRSTIYAYMKQGRFPAPIRLGQKAVGWLERDIQSWIEEQIQERDDRLKKQAQKRKSLFPHQKGGKA
jgi:prophage regulatory protein